MKKITYLFLYYIIFFTIFSYLSYSDTGGTFPGSTPTYLSTEEISKIDFEKEPAKLDLVDPKDINLVPDVAKYNDKLTPEQKAKLSPQNAAKVLALADSKLASASKPTTQKPESKPATTSPPETTTTSPTPETTTPPETTEPPENNPDQTENPENTEQEQDIQPIEHLEEYDPEAMQEALNEIGYESVDSVDLGDNPTTFKDGVVSIDVASDQTPTDATSTETQNPNSETTTSSTTPTTKTTTSPSSTEFPESSTSSSSTSSTKTTSINLNGFSDADSVGFLPNGDINVNNAIFSGGQNIRKIMDMIIADYVGFAIYNNIIISDATNLRIAGDTLLMDHADSIIIGDAVLANAYNVQIPFTFSFQIFNFTITQFDYTEFQTDSVDFVKIGDKFYENISNAKFILDDQQTGITFANLTTNIDNDIFFENPLGGDVIVDCLSMISQ